MNNSLITASNKTLNETQKSNLFWAHYEAGLKSYQPDYEATPDVSRWIRHL